MVNTRHICVLILYCTFLFIHPVYSQSNNKIRILNSDILKYNKKVDPDLKRLLGNVILQHNFTLMYCDSAFLYEEKNMFEAFGHVKILQGDSLSLICDFARYRGIDNVAEARKNVVLKDKKMTLYTESLDFNTQTSTGYYFSGGRITNESTILTSEMGHYYSSNKSFYFKENVVVTDPNYQIKSDTLKYNADIDKVFFLGPTVISNEENYIYCEYGWYQTKDSISQFEKNAFIKNDEQIVYGDLLYYNQLSKKGKARDNVKIHDFIRDIIVEGHKADFDRASQLFTMTDSAILTLITEDDSIYIHADTLKSEFDSTNINRQLKAYYHAKFYKNDLQGKCDSLIYLLKDSIIQLHKNPVLWSGENQMTSNYIEGYIKNNTFNKIWLQTSAFIISKEEEGKYNQIKGKEMTGYFAHNELYKVEVFGNGQMIYFPKEENDIVGLNKVESSNLILYIENRKIKRVNFITKPNAKLSPIADISLEEMKLKNFIWYGEYKPYTREDIFIWISNKQKME